MEYVPGNLYDLEELIAAQEPEPEAKHCFRCAAYINHSEEGWVCYDCWKNYMEWARSYGDEGAGARAMARARREQRLSPMYGGVKWEVNVDTGEERRD